jgi:sugar (pentulose or hexulose) kinase
VVQPDPAAHERYRAYVAQYEETYESLKDASHRLVKSL